MRTSFAALLAAVLLGVSGASAADIMGGEYSWPPPRYEMQPRADIAPPIYSDRHVYTEPEIDEQPYGYRRPLAAVPYGGYGPRSEGGYEEPAYSPPAPVYGAPCRVQWGEPEWDGRRWVRPQVRLCN
jgi:hypothetical protein